MTPLESELLPHAGAATPKFNPAAALKTLAAILSDTEVGAIAPLLTTEKRLPEGLFRHDGVLYVRYFTSHWIVKQSALERLNGMAPWEGIERLTTPG